MKNLVYTLAAIILLTSACAQNNNKTAGTTNRSSNNDNGTALKVDEKDLTGKYVVDNFIVKTEEGDFDVVFAGLRESRDLTKNEDGTYSITQRSELKGCTREITSQLIVDGSRYVRLQFDPATEKCSAACPQVIQGEFQRDGKIVLGPKGQKDPGSSSVACGLNKDTNESGTTLINGSNLTFEMLDKDSGLKLHESNSRVE